MHDADHNANSIGHETLETDVRTVWRTAAVIVGVVIAAYTVILGMMNWFATGDGPPANQQAQTEPAWNEQMPLQRLRTREQNWLSQYEWVDRDAGVARIPVDRAVEIVAKNGLPGTLSAAGTADATRRPNAAENDRAAPGNNQP